MNQKFSQYIGIFIKILFLAIGLADFFGVLPPSLDILDKLITSLILAYFWYELKFSSFLFGKRKQWLDWSILATYYILVSESVIGLFFDASHISLLSSITVSVGFGSLILISAYVANKLTFSKKSVMHSFARLFIRKEEQWNNFADTQGSSKIVKFFLSLIVLFAIFQYFFSLVNQWFVISLDKTLLVLAILFAVKDIKGTKSKVLNKIGDFDDWLLKTITELFTNHKKFYLGFSVLLIFH
ncbi:MAG: hypothetical protein KC535_05920, partial [Nanoarchaeota archaeon]|nr:hypothetical protein [Nanoarchaeota archaeon]